MTASISKIFDVAIAEVRTSRRLARFWTIAILLSLFSIVGYAMSCAFLGYSAVTSPSFGTGVPKYLLGNIDPTFFLMFQIAALFLAFDAGHQHSRNRISEVLDSKPVTNFEYLAGRVLGIAGLLWLIAAVNVCVMQLFGWISQTTSIGIADTIETHSLINLLVFDAPATLLIWCSVVVFLSSVLRYRMLIVSVGLALMFAWFFLILNTPYSLLAIVSPSSNDTLFVSELLPQLASLPVMAIRVATILTALVFITLSALLLRRQDNGIRLTNIFFLAVFLALGTLLYSLGSSHAMSAYDDTTRWQEVHENYDWNVPIDVETMTGKLRIDPENNLDIDLTLTYQAGSSSTETLAFTFNPSMDIHELNLNGSPAEYSFQNGLLEITKPTPMDSGRTYVLHLVASGVPDQSFAYFDSAFDYVRSPGVSNQTISLLGTKGSIFNSRYVALMPGVYWYPVPGPMQEDYLSTQKGLDYFDLDLVIELVPRDWKLVGPDCIAQESDGARLYSVKPSNPINEVGLFASEFESTSIEIENTVFNLHLHKRHASNLRLFDEFGEVMRTTVRNQMQRFSEHGLTLPYSTLSFVEVPNQLRTIGGGWRMNSLETLPGIVLLKEHGYPTARLDLALERLNRSDYEEDQIPVVQLTLLSDYFRHGIATDNPWSGLPQRFWSHRTSARGEFAPALDQIVLTLVSHLVQHQHEFFSIYSTTHFADTTALSFFQGVEDGIERNATPTIATTRRLRSSYVTRTSVANSLEASDFSDFPTRFGNQHDFEFLLLKSKQIADALVSINGDEKIFAWLAELLAMSTGRTYSYEELVSTADKHGVTIDPFLTDWLSSNTLPGYVASTYTTFRVADDEQGNPRYQTSVTVRNIQPVAGFVRLEFPTEESWNWSHPYLTGSDGVRIEGGTSKKINLQTSYEVRSLYLDPGLSLNRSSFVLTKSTEPTESLPKVNSAPLEEASSWKPTDEEGIVVDDLDPGFVVEQRRIRVSRSSRVGPINWVRLPRLDGELDNGLPISGVYLFEYRAPSSAWSRLDYIHNAYGKFRKTTARTYVRQTSPKATFLATLPESSVWRLDYHAPVQMEEDWDKGLKYELVISDESESYDAELDVYGWNLGWNSVGEFNLDAGKVSVDLVGTSKRGPLYADAIRWSKVQAD